MQDISPKLAGIAFVPIEQVRFVNGNRPRSLHLPVVFSTMLLFDGNQLVHGQNITLTVVS